MNKILIYLNLFISLIFAQFDLEPRMIGLSGAYTTIADGYHSIGINPANLSTNKSLSMNLFSINGFMVNDFMSMKLYNDINGADFDDTGSAAYYPKSDLLEQIKGSAINIEMGMIVPLPILNFAYKNFGISTNNRTYIKFDLPKSILDIMLNGNTKGKRFLLDLAGEAISTNEIGLTYAHTFIIDEIQIQLGATFKYLQGIAYLQMRDIENNGSYIYTEQTSFHGSGKYLIEQAFGGAGTATDIGILLPKFIDGWNLGLSIINLGGNIEWGANNLTRGLIGSAIESATGLRQNEYYYLDFKIDSMNIMSYFDSEEELISSDFYEVGIFSDIPLASDASDNDLLVYNISEGGDSVLSVTNHYLIDSLLIIDMGNGSYLVPSENLQSNQLQSQSSKTIHLDYPSFLRIGASKEINNYGLVSFDLVTGFDDSFGNSNKFRFSVGTEITRINKRLPVRLGFSIGGRQPNSYSFGIGYSFGPISLDFGRKYYHGLIMSRAKGAEYSFNISMDMTDFSFKETFKFKFPNIKLPKLPKLPGS